MPLSEEPGLKFIIVGASIAGLTSALALKAAGHSVLVLEKEEHLCGADTIPSGGARVPPNGCKVLFDLGLEAEIRENAVVGEGLMMYTYNSEGKDEGWEYFGLNLWDPELLIEACGDFLQMRHRDLVHILYNATMKERGTDDQSGCLSGVVTILFDAEVTDIDCDNCVVTMRSGEKHTGDAIVGADGASGLVRKCLIKEHDSSRDDAFTGLAFYSANIAQSIAIGDDELTKLYQYPRSNMVTLLVGNNRGAEVFLAGKDRDIQLCVYTPDSPQDGSWNEKAKRDIREVVGPCNLLMQKLVAHAGPSTCVQIKDHCELNSWVSTSGKVLVVGEAAHPFPPISLHTCSVAIEDGAFLGKIFSHTQDPSRIPEFFNAFEENRCGTLAALTSFKLRRAMSTFMTLPDGEKQISRDAMMRANHAAGRNVLDAPEEDMHTLWENLRKVYGYDPADAADEWWVSWGRFRQ
ncbi:FAD-binding-3 domain-containing protein [Mycena venus]|uniref:FAD-binding-3 domain-containing protein n=1 Tax=Mycena venus TaxID=2733690 RepID=A0A8H6X7V5_9AGAR|nr:FAD-binding-3 domain-containing protein [Mycena venus]